MTAKSGKKKTEASTPEAQPLSVMLGLADKFTVNDKRYEIAVLPLKEVAKFMQDEVSVGPQLFNLISDENREKVDSWMQKCVRDEKGEPYSLEQAMEDGWTLRDLREMFQRMLDISG